MTGCLLAVVSPSLIKNRTPIELQITEPNEIPSLRIDVLSRLHVSVFGSHYLCVTRSNLNLLVFTNWRKDDRFAYAVCDELSMSLQRNDVFCNTLDRSCSVCRPGGVCDNACVVAIRERMGCPGIAAPSCAQPMFGGYAVYLLVQRN